MELKRLSVTHDQIMDWLIANPMLPLSRCAAEFGYTQPWLSSLIHSDLFQAKLQERQEQVFGEVALSVKDRITALAHDSLKRLHEKIIVEEDVDKLNSTAELTMKALGFAPKEGRPGVSVVVNNGVVTKDVLAEARARMERKLRLVEATTIEALPAVPKSIENASKGDE